MGGVLREGQLIVTTTGLGRIQQVGRYNGVDGAWITNRTGDPNSSVAYPTFAAAWCIRLAVIGETVCPTPRGRCFCGLTHVTAEELTWLPRKGADPGGDATRIVEGRVILSKQVTR